LASQNRDRRVYCGTFERKDFLQRLFSMFPNGWPGRGLLLLRIVAGILPIYDGIARLMGAAPHESAALQLIAASAGVFLLAGFWTPIAGALLAVTDIWIALSGTAHLRSSILLATMGAAIAVLGPGAWSIDALLFGRKRLDI
jgi:putative oxidoreductase